MAGLRISGLASGMDIDSIVSDLMKAERLPLDKITQKKTYTEWQRDDYRTMNTALSELDKLIFEGIGKQASFNKKTVTVSNENAISVKNVNSMSNFSGTVKVDQLATAATMISKAPAAIKLTDKFELSSSLSSYVGKNIAIKAINKDGDFDKQKDANGAVLPDKDKVFSYTIKDGDTLESIINKINADSGVTVFFDEKSQKFSITAKNTGDAKVNESGAVTDLPEIVLGTSINTNGVDEFTEEGTSGFFKEIMGMGSRNKGAINPPTEFGGEQGKNAILTYNGLKIERSSNTFTINGAQLTIKKTTATDETVTFSSTPDVDTIYDTIKKFVDSYNGLIANISDKTAERKNKNYAPLSDEQKKAMSDDEVKKWEAIARKGTLSRDSTLSSLLTKMRSSIYTSVNEGNSFGSLAKIGISTTKNYLEGGKLEINETTLRKAIEEDPNGIYNLFMVKVEKEQNGKQVTDLDKSGVVRRLREDLKAAMTNISEKAGKTSSVNNTFTLGKLLDNYKDKISAFEEKMKNLESRYYKQFTAMEKAINRANSQSASLTSFFTR